MHKILWKIGGIVAAVAASGLARKGVERLHERFDPEIDPDDVVKPDDTADGEDTAEDAATDDSETGGEADDDEPEG